jgi:protein gp37
MVLSKPMFAAMEIKMENSKIEWADHTFNPWIGCRHVSPGCDHCYAETQNAFRKWNGGTWGPHAPRKRTSEENWKNPLKWNAEAREFKREHGHRPRVFCASLADVFGNQVPRSGALWSKAGVSRTPRSWTNMGREGAWSI